MVVVVEPPAYERHPYPERFTTSLMDSALIAFPAQFLQYGTSLDTDPSRGFSLRA